MLTKQILLLSTVSLLLTLPLSAAGQGIGEYGGLNAGMAGMGAGLAASLNHGAVVRRTYESALEAQQAFVAQNKAVEQYYKLGNQFELKKQWENAEKAFMYVVQVIAKRDGPGSAKSVPALKHLVHICENQNKIDSAISFQKTVLTFTKGVKVPDPKALIGETDRLSNLFIRKNDYASAAPLLHDEVALCKQSSVPPQTFERTLRVYGTVLRRLDREDEAKKVDEMLVSLTAEAKSLDPIGKTSGSTSSQTSGSSSSAIPSILSSEGDSTPAKVSDQAPGDRSPVKGADVSVIPVTVPPNSTTPESSVTPASGNAENATPGIQTPASAPQTEVKSSEPGKNSQEPSSQTGGSDKQDQPPADKK